MSVNLLISFKVKNEKLQSFKSIMKNVKENLPSVFGCQEVRILNNVENPLEFTLLERWTSKEIHRAYIDGLITSGKWAAIAEHLQQPPSSGYYQEV